MSKRAFASAPPARALALAKEVFANDDDAAKDKRFKHMLRATLGIKDQTIKFCPVRENERYVKMLLLLPNRSPDFSHTVYVFGSRLIVGPMGPTYDRVSATDLDGQKERDICTALRLQFLLKRAPTWMPEMTAPRYVTFALLRTIDTLEVIEWRPPCVLPLGEYAIPMPWCNPNRRSVRPKNE